MRVRKAALFVIKINYIINLIMDVPWYAINISSLPPSPTLLTILLPTFLLFTLTSLISSAISKEGREARDVRGKLFREEEELKELKRQGQVQKNFVQISKQEVREAVDGRRLRSGIDGKAAMKSHQ